MRKTRKGTADVPAVPSSSPPPQVEVVQEPKRHCLQCMQRPAADVTIYKDRTGGEIFCSLACAAVWAASEVNRQKYRWCNDHLEWSDRHGVCVSCAMAKQDYAKHLYGDQVRYHQGGKGVQQ